MTWVTGLCLVFSVPGLVQAQPRAADRVASQGSDAVSALEQWLTTAQSARGDAAADQAFADIPLHVAADQTFADVPLSAAEAARARELLWEDRVVRLRAERQEEFAAKQLQYHELVMPFDYQVFGDAPETGRTLVISMHGGGGAPQRVNDRQWENQKRLYTLDEGVYVAPRAPTDTWNLWHQAHIDVLFDRLIQDMVIFENVNPDRVYLMGYSAGGDGVFQLAPRLADRFAAAAMMAGHPNETTPDGLRNLPFTLHMGANDAAFNRNAVAAQWEKQLAALQAADPQGYPHWVEIHADKGHWMDRQDAAAIPWMMSYTRQCFPKRVVWKQDDVTHDRFYWLAVPNDEARAGVTIVAEVSGQVITIQQCQAARLRLRLDDELIDLDQPISVLYQGVELIQGQPERTIRALMRSLDERPDPRLMSSAEVAVSLPSAAVESP